MQQKVNSIENSIENHDSKFKNPLELTFEMELNPKYAGDNSFQNLFSLKKVIHSLLHVISRFRLNIEDRAEGVGR